MTRTRYEVLIKGVLDIRPSMRALFNEALIPRIVELTLPDHYEHLEQRLADDGSFLVNMGSVKPMIPSLHSVNQTEFVYVSVMVDKKGQITYWETIGCSKEEYKLEGGDI